MLDRTVSLSLRQSEIQTIIAALDAQHLALGEKFRAEFHKLEPITQEKLKLSHELDTLSNQMEHLETLMEELSSLVS